MEAENYPLEIRVNDQKVVHSAFIRFRGLLHELELSPHADEVLAIKLQVDTNPPSGANLQTTLIERHITLNIQHHDQASLLAGKVHALLQRSYAKGRDWFDLHWYLSQPNWPLPNISMLNAALEQSNWQENALTKENWRTYVAKKLQTLNWQTILDDVAPFLLVSDIAFQPETLLRNLN